MLQTSELQHAQKNKSSIVLLVGFGVKLLNGLAAYAAYHPYMNIIDASVTHASKHFMNINGACVTVYKM